MTGYLLLRQRFGCATIIVHKKPSNWAIVTAIRQYKAVAHVISSPTLVSARARRIIVFVRRAAEKLSHQGLSQNNNNYYRCHREMKHCELGQASLGALFARTISPADKCVRIIFSCDAPHTK